MERQPKITVAGIHLLKSRSPVVAIVLLLGLAGLACNTSLDQTQTNGDADGPDPVEDSSSGIALPPENTAPPFEIATIIQGDLWNLGGLASYRSDYVVTFDGFAQGEAVQGSMSLLLEVTSDPPAQHFLMDLEGYDLGETSLVNTEMYILDESIYINLGFEEEWMTFPGSSIESMQETLLLPQNFVDLPPAAPRSLLPESVNGVMSWHYKIDDANFQVASAVYDTMKADVWVAVDGGYLVKMDATFSGSFGEGSAFLDRGTIQFLFNLLTINQVFTITLPPAALQATDFDLDDLGK